ERELPLRRPAPDVLAMRAKRLGEALVEKSAAAAGDPVEDAVDRAAPVSEVVEAEIDVVAQQPRRLRRRVRVDELGLARDRVRRAGVVAARVLEEIAQIANDRETQAGDERIGRLVFQLVQ